MGLSKHYQKPTRKKKNNDRNTNISLFNKKSPLNAEGMCCNADYRDEACLCYSETNADFNTQS